MKDLRTYIDSDDNKDVLIVSFKEDDGKVNRLPAAVMYLNYGITSLTLDMDGQLWNIGAMMTDSELDKKTIAQGLYNCLDSLTADGMNTQEVLEAVTNFYCALMFARILDSTENTETVKLYALTMVGRRMDEISRGQSGHEEI